MAVANNPASRLHDLLIRARHHNPDGTGYFIWGSIFGYVTLPDRPLNEEGMNDVVLCFIRLRRLVDESYQAVASLKEEDEDVLLSPFETIKSTLNLKGLEVNNYKTYLQQIHDSQMHILSLCARTLHRRRPERLADMEELAKIRTQVDTLIVSVLESELEPTLRNFVLIQLNHIRHALHEYSVGGVERLNETLSYLVGSMYLKRDIIEPNQGNKYLNALLTIIIAFGALTTFASDATTTIANVAPLYQLLSSGEPEVPAPPMSDGTLPTLGPNSDSR